MHLTTKLFFTATLLAGNLFASFAGDVTLKITKKYINLPVSHQVDRKKMTFEVKGTPERNFVIRLADEKPDYWVFCDVSSWKGKTLRISYEGESAGLEKIYQEIIQDELNVKKVEFTDDVRAFTSYSFKPQLRTVGRKYGKYVNEIKEILAGLDGNQAMDTLNETDLLSFETQDGTKVELAKEDLLIDMAQVPGFVSEGDNFVTVVLDTNLTPELIEEGFVREIISKIQTMRKEAGFEVMNHINVFQDGNDKLAEILKNHTEEIKKEVLADNILIGTMGGHTKEWDINGEKGMFGVEKTTD